MSKTFRNFGILLAGTCGALTAYAALQPALEEQRAQRLGYDLSPKQKAYGTIISDQMREDFKQAEKEWNHEGGFGWGIRALLRGRNPYSPSQVRVEGKGEGEGKRQGEIGSKEQSASDTKNDEGAKG